MDEQNRHERGKTYGREKRCVFKVRFERAQGGCLTERQREFVPGRGRDQRWRKRERERKPTVESLDR